MSQATGKMKPPREKVSKRKRMQTRVACNNCRRLRTKVRDRHMRQDEAVTDAKTSVMACVPLASYVVISPPYSYHHVTMLILMHQEMRDGGDTMCV